MARISTYAKDTVVTKYDKVIGTDSAGNVTKNFELSDLANFFSRQSTVAGQVAYQFKNFLTDASLTGPADSTDFADITTFKLSEIDSNDHNIEDFLPEYANTEIIVVQIDNKNNYGIFRVNSVVEDSENLNYYDFSLDFLSGNGSLILDKYYLIAFKDGVDKHATLAFSSATFGTPPNEETLDGKAMKYIDFSHNLNKRPSITVTEAGAPDRVAIMPVKYLNDNTVRVYFNGTTSGKIYAN